LKTVSRLEEKTEKLEHSDKIKKNKNAQKEACKASRAL
jgi:hypothetical protein